MDFRILGPLEVSDGDREVALGGAKQRALLAMLLLHANEVVSNDQLVDELWPEDGLSEGSRALQVAISRLRKALEPARPIVTRPPGYALQVDPERLDLRKFEEGFARGRERLAARDYAAAAKTLSDALTLWRGRPLADLAYESFCQSEIARLEELRATALEDRVAADLELGQHAGLVGELQDLVGRNPLRERLQTQLILAFYRSGRQAEALEAYQQARSALVEGLGIEPGRDLQELHAAMLKQDPSLDRDRREEAPVEPQRGSFVGREAELSQLVSALDDAFAGHARLVLVAGEAGGGKSRLADELIARARTRGAAVRTGRSWEAGGAPAYWPWVQVLRSHVRHGDPETIRSQLTSGVPGIVQVVLPEVRELLPDLPPPPSLEGEGGRFRLFDAMASLLRNAAAVQPLVLVLDDLHAADASSLLLLEFLAGEIADSPILVVVAYRDTELAADHPLVSTLAELQRYEATTRIALGGLSEGDIGRLVEVVAGVEAPESLASALHDQTGGNPLFVGEVVKFLAAEGRLDSAVNEDSLSLTIPQSVRDVIARRLRRLPGECGELLTYAAVLGREFTLEALGRISDLNGETLLDDLDEAITAGVVIETQGARGQLRFSHALIRDVLYEALPPGKRARLHQACGDALEALNASDPAPVLTELCHHFCEALPEGDSAKALMYARRAGDAANGSLAHEEAVRLYRLALQVMESEQPEDEAARCELLLRLGDVQMRYGDGPAAKDSFWRAAEIARRASMPASLARAALGYGGRFVWSRAAGDRRLVPLLREALSSIGEDERSLRVRLLARLSGALRDAPSRDQAASFSLQAVELARTLAEPATLAYALDARHIVIWGPDRAEERAAIAAEILELAEEAGDDERIFEALFWRLETMLDMGDLPGMRSLLEGTARLADDLKQPAQLWYVAVTRALLALFEGRLAEAEELIGRALALGQQAQSWEALVYYRIQMFGLRSAQGRLEETEESIRRAVEEYPGYPVLRCVLACVYSELGRDAECALIFDGLAADDFAELPRDEEWLFAMTLIASACAFLGDVPRAAVLHDLLSPYADRNALSVPDLSTGSVSRSLGVLAATSGHRDDAIAHFENALIMNAGMGARPWLARTQHEYAAVLFDGGADDDAEKGRELLRLAVDGYRELGMDSWADRATAMAR